MSIPKFSDIISFSNNEIYEQVIKTENELFNLRFKKLSRQPFKSHEIKKAKHRLAQLKTLLTLQLKEQEGKDILDELIPN
jgi:large subunit ribosomal protein L29